MRCFWLFILLASQPLAFPPYYLVYIEVLKDGGDIIALCSPAGVSQPYHLHLLHLCHICFHDSAKVKVTVNVLHSLKLHRFTSQSQPDADSLHEFIIDYSIQHISTATYALTVQKGWAVGERTIITTNCLSIVHSNHVTWLVKTVTFLDCLAFKIKTGLFSPLTYMYLKQQYQRPLFSEGSFGFSLRQRNMICLLLLVWRRWYWRR